VDSVGAQRPVASVMGPGAAACKRSFVKRNGPVARPVHFNDLRVTAQSPDAAFGVLCALE
jgi:hypothetical protein